MNKLQLPIFTLATLSKVFDFPGNYNKCQSPSTVFFFTVMNNKWFTCSKCVKKKQNDEKKSELDRSETSSASVQSGLDRNQPQHRSFIFCVFYSQTLVSQLQRFWCGCHKQKLIVSFFLFFILALLGHIKTKTKSKWFTDFGSVTPTCWRELVFQKCMTLLWLTCKLHCHTSERKRA